jgi:hypothetical protein
VNTNDVDQRIRAALNAAAGEITENDLRPEHAPTADPRRPWRQARWLAPVLAAAAVIAVVVGTAAVVSSTQSSSHKAPPANTGEPVPTSSASVSEIPTASPSPTSTPTTNGAAFCGLPAPGCEGIEVSYEPLWPFATYADAQQWQKVDGPAGHQPWHLDAGQTALLFTQNYLGYQDITKVTSTLVDAQGAHVGVGYDDPNGKPRTAAVLHLVRYSTVIGDTTAGWEVVGSDDTDFSLEQPGYGSQVSSPMTVGGHISGVDENIVVVVRNQSGAIVSGDVASVAAGGENSPWHTTAAFSGSGVLTIVAFTGGHLMEHERFAIQGVHT